MMLVYPESNYFSVMTQTPSHAAGGSARTHQVLPRHRQAVATYFGRQDLGK